MTQSNRAWWRESVIYQVYPLSFADGNGDGIGDLRGVIDRLDYLNDGNPDSPTALGVDAIWLSPVNCSPMHDSGYDVSDYYAIHPDFGTLADYKELLEAAHYRGMKVIFDLVVNHTSDQHPWFLESRSSRDNSKADWYIWHDPVPGQNCPNNWRSYFGGSGWEYVPEREQFYFHTFEAVQPDLNWRNPDVKAAIYDVLRFWLDQGVDGFRLDASSIYSKDAAFRNEPLKFGATDEDNFENYYHVHTRSLPENHQIIKEMREIVDGYGDRLLIGETFIDNETYESVIFYGINNDELHLPLTFEFPLSPHDAGYLQRSIARKENETPAGAQPCYFFDNHDIPRQLSRWKHHHLAGGRQAIAKAAATILLTVRGTPILYYGQEIGMVNHENLPADRLHDEALRNAAADAPPPRDGARTPMQWDDSPQAGFSFGKAVEPWLPVHHNYPRVNVEAELEDDQSILNFYRRLLRLRRQSEALRRGDWQPLIYYAHDYLVYLRTVATETVLVVVNFCPARSLHLDVPPPHDQWTVLLSTHYDSGKQMRISDSLQAYEVSIFGH